MVESNPISESERDQIIKLLEKYKKLLDSYNNGNCSDETLWSLRLSQRHLRTIFLLMGWELPEDLQKNL